MTSHSSTSADLSFPAELDDATVEQLERTAGHEVGQSRRLALTVCSRDSETLATLAREDPEAFDEVCDAVMAFAEHTQGLRSMAESALSRIAAVRQAVYGDESASPLH